MFKRLEVSELKKTGKPCIIVPFREQVEQGRGEQLKKFIAHMKRWHPDWVVLVIEQSDKEKFNRGALLNVGSRIAASTGFEYVIYHDVDLIPLSPIVPYYEHFPDHPVHIGKAWDAKYPGDTFLGGVMSISIKDIKKINGFPNNFWGWGGEDDAMRKRLKKKGMFVYQPVMRTGFKELPHKDTRTIPGAKNMRKWEDVAEDNGSSGFRNVKWKEVEKKEITPSIHIISVELQA